MFGPKEIWQPCSRRPRVLGVDLRRPRPSVEKLLGHVAKLFRLRMGNFVFQASRPWKEEPFLRALIIEIYGIDFKSEFFFLLQIGENGPTCILFLRKSFRRTRTDVINLKVFSPKNSANILAP
jgi:hypothetical protein